MDIIATVPTHFTPEKIRSIVNAGATILRINGAHSTCDAVAEFIIELRELQGDHVRIMLDLPTNKIRTRNLDDSIAFDRGGRFSLHLPSLNYPVLHEIVRVGDVVTVNDGRNRLRIVRIGDSAIEFEAESRGILGNNRGLIFEREIHAQGFPLFLERDLELVEIINDLRVDLVGISYLRYPEEKMKARTLIRDSASLVFKIETRVAFKNYRELLEPGDKILIDRGDLAGEIGLIHIPQAQDRLIRFAHRANITVYCATQFLATMVASPVPQISEVCSLYEILKLGIDGLQLSEETALGEYPEAAVRWVRRIEELLAEEGDIPHVAYAG